MNAAQPIRAETDPRMITLAVSWLAGELHIATGVDIAAGVTDARTRVERIRKLIAERGLAERTLGHASGKAETYRSFCLRALGLDMDSPQEGLQL